MNILNIDSTSGKMLITLSRDGELASFISRRSDRRYMEMIIGCIDRVLKKAGIGIGEVDAIGVNKGPGDFTGTRIGISVAKTLGWVLDVPVYGINALDAAAYGIAYRNIAGISKSIAAGKDVFILPCLDVKKDELYFSRYKITGPGDEYDLSGHIAIINRGDRAYGIKRIAEMTLIDSGGFPGSFEKWLSGAGSRKASSVFLGGNCVTGYEKMLLQLAGIVPELCLDRKNIFPHPGSLDACVGKCIEDGIPGQRVDPIYVRDFVPFGRQGDH
jgi:tRNA threonylcarbamoyl adenosine modification protein YeaZ